jgi:hypothetical protein
MLGGIKSGWNKMGDFPHGAVQNKAELQRLIDEARKSPITIYLVFRRRRDSDNGVHKRILHNEASISGQYVEYRCVDNTPKNCTPIFAYSSDAEVGAWIFTNYWYAFAHAERTGRGGGLKE